MRERLLNILSGLIDGITIALALAAGLSAIISSAHTVFLASVSVMTAWSITLAIGAYLTRKKENASGAFSGALVLGISYIIGGVICVGPFAILPQSMAAFRYSVPVALIILFICGFLDSRASAANPWIGAIRVALTAGVASAAAFGVGLLFR